MPRASTKRQPAQGAANHRDTRHENGLVGPGKRVHKQKSNGHLNGHAKASESLPPTPPLPGTPPTSNGHVQDPVPADTAMVPKLPVDTLRRSQLGAYSESSESESYNNPPLSPTSHENHRRIDVNNAKNPAVHRDVGPLSLTLTVLRACPLYDTIAILIVLLQLPPTFLSIIQILFATLTFVPPSNLSGMSFVDIFEGRVTTPSVATIVVVDLIVLLVWLFLWSPLQDIALDLAQSVIALTLGGATSGREAGMRNVFVCFGIIGVNHFTHNNNGKQLGLGGNLSSLAKGYLGSPDLDDPLERISHKGKKKGTHGWIQSILAIHILTQGAVRYIRDWYVRREKRGTSTSTGDPEAGKALAETITDSSNLQTADNDSSTSLAVSSHAATLKQRKKQTQQLRTRQPLWAALASTKIVMVKEYETSSAAVESAGTNATDINNLGNAPFDSEPDRIWITFIGSDSVYFSTSYFPNYTPPEICEESRGSECAGADQSKPFYVRVNSSTWQPTRIYTNQPDGQPLTQDTRWEGEIYGLAPISSYTCDFISTVDGSVLFSTSVRTRQPQLLDVAGAGLAPVNPTVAGRPGSPTTTLKTSIATSEVKLAEERSRQKRERKEQRAKLNSFRKDIDKLSSNIASSGGNDDKLRQKIQQSNLHMKQAEESLDNLAADIQAFSSIPKEDESAYRSSKKAYQSEKDHQKQFRSEFDETKQSNERDLQALSNEVSSLQQKRERMLSRITKLNGELERIADANEKGLNEAQRRDTDRQYKIQERAAMETMLLDRLQTLTNEINMLVPSLQNFETQVQMMLNAEVEMNNAYNAQAASPTTSAPNLAYGEIPEVSNSPWNPGPSTASLYAPPAFTMSYSQPVQFKRGRSSSMLSNVSGFTQSSGEGPSQPVQPSFKWMSGDNRKCSSGSGSTSISGSGGGSVGDPKSPIGNGNGKAAKWLSDRPADGWDEK